MFEIDLETNELDLEHPHRDEEEDTLEATWWLFDEESVPNLWEKNKEGLKEDLEVFENLSPVLIDDEERLYEAKYEFIKYGAQFKYENALIKGLDNPIGWAEFLGGVPYASIELMALLFVENTEPEDYPVIEAKGNDPTAPMPDNLFEGFREKDIVYNVLFVEDDWLDAFTDSVKGEVKAPRWWQRLNFFLKDPEEKEKEKRPTPGEFVSLGIRMFPDKPWGTQKSSPFLSSGNWFDTLYYTSAKVVEVLEPEEDRPFKLYKVRWRANDDDETEFLARSSGFEEYQVDDRVAILKDAATDRQSQTWEDDKEFDQNVWRIVPVTFWKKEEES